MCVYYSALESTHVDLREKRVGMVLFFHHADIGGIELNLSGVFANWAFSLAPMSMIFNFK